MQRLRTKTRASRAGLERTPFVAALRDHSLSRDAYVGWLRALHLLHETLEAELARTEDPCVRAVWRPQEQRRTPMLERDLAVFAGVPLRETRRAQLHALLLAQEIRVQALAAPSRLLGVVIALQMPAWIEASERAALAEALALPMGAGLDSLYSGDDSPVDFAGRMDAAVSQAQIPGVVATAEAMLAGLEATLWALHPLTDDDVAGDAGWAQILNAEAGTHAVSDDLREIDAALRAGEASLRAMPYYERRYGARGRRFTRSDSAWLVTLCHVDPVRLRQHILWLGRLLATRGMPRLLLEEHLQGLHASLCQTLPERRDRYQPLLTAHALLRDARLGILDQPTQTRLAQMIDGELAERAGLPRIGALLVAAVIDEADGITQAVTSVMGWLEEIWRDQPALVAAAEATVAAARAAIATAHAQSS